MEALRLILVSVGLLSLAMLGLAIRILIKKGGRFPNTHVSGNKYLRKKGISCVQTYDRIEQAKAREKVDFENVKLADRN